MIFVMIYFCLFLPIRLCFTYNADMFDRQFDFEGDDIFLEFDIFIGVLLVSDIVLTFFSAFENEAGLLIF